MSGRIVEGIVERVAPLSWRHTVSVTVRDEDTGALVPVVVDLARPWHIEVGDWLSVEVRQAGGSLCVESGVWQAAGLGAGRPRPPRTASRASG